MLREIWILRVWSNPVSGPDLHNIQDGLSRSFWSHASVCKGLRSPTVWIVKNPKQQMTSFDVFVLELLCNSNCGYNYKLRLLSLRQLLFARHTKSRAFNLVQSSPQLPQIYPQQP